MKRCFAVTLFLILLLSAPALGACQKEKLEADSALVYYKNQDATLPMYFGNVTEVKEYHVDGKLYQLLVYQADRLTPVVFTPVEIIRYSRGRDVSVQKFEGEVYHTYDPYLQRIKNEQRKEFLHEAFLQYFGREAAKDEFNAAMEKLTQKVQIHDLEERLKTAPEAVIYRLNGLRAVSLSQEEEKDVIKMLEDGYTIDKILEVFDD